MVKEMKLEILSDCQRQGEYSHLHFLTDYEKNYLHYFAKLLVVSFFHDNSRNDYIFLYSSFILYTFNFYLLFFVFLWFYMFF